MPKIGVASPKAIADVKTVVDSILVDTGTTLDALVKDIPSLSETPVYAVYPKLASQKDITGTDEAWTWGEWTEIVPANTITEDFWFFGLIDAETGTATNHVIQVGIGGSGSEVAIWEGCLRQFVYGAEPSIIPRKIPANTRVAARLAQSGAAAQNRKVKMLYATGL